MNSNAQNRAPTMAAMEGSQFWCEAKEGTGCTADCAAARRFTAGWKKRISS